MNRFTSIFLLFFCLAAGTVSVHASHVYGGWITYECVGACSVDVKLTTYRDCAGALTISPNSTAFTPVDTACAIPVPVNNWPTVFVVEFTPACPSVQTNCANSQSSIPGIQEYSWTRTYDYCAVANNCAFAVSWTTCCRNGSITNLASANSESIYVFNTFVVDSAQGCNNAPIFPNTHTLYVPQGQETWMHLGAYDPDGDSLAYSLGPCFSNNNQICLYNSPYTPTQPLGPSWNVSLDPVTGNLHYVPQPGNIVVSVICIYVEEWRNGVLIGNMVRDFQTTIIPSPGNGSPKFSAYSNVSANVTQQNDVFYSCNNTLVQFDVALTDTNTGQTLSLWWDQNIPGATFANPTNTVQDSLSGLAPVGRFTFNPPSPGVYKFTLFGSDNNCPILGYQHKGITIVAGSGGGSTNANAIQNGCFSADFSALACGGTGTYTYQWSGSGGISSTNATFTHTFSGGGTFPWQVVISDGASIQDTIRDTLVIPVSQYLPMIQPQGLIFFCQNGSVTLQAGNGYTSYLWSTGDTTQSIVVNSQGVFSLTTTDFNGCVFYDSVMAIPTGPTPANLITGSSVLNSCTPGPHVLTAMPFYSTYLWSTGATTDTIHIQTSGTYGVTVENVQGCVRYDSIVVTAGTTADISGYATNYLGNPLQFTQIYLIDHDTMAGTLTAVDSVQTDFFGYYQFCNIVDSILYVKAAPDSASYPQDMPTYADSSLFWNGATAYSVATAPHTVNFSTIFGTNPGGLGFIGGLISQGANKMDGPGDPVEGLILLLYNMDTQSPVGLTTTDANGYFSFADIPLGNYSVRPDKPGVDENNTPQLQLNALSPQKDSLRFRLYSDRLELVTGTGLLTPAEFSAELGPNPFRDVLALNLQLATAAEVQWKLFNATGQQMAASEPVEMASGKHALQLCAACEAWSAGIYFLELTVGGQRKVLKTIKIE